MMLAFAWTANGVAQTLTAIALFGGLALGSLVLIGMCISIILEEKAAKKQRDKEREREDADFRKGEKPE